MLIKDKYVHHRLYHRGQARISAQRPVSGEDRPLSITSMLLLHFESLQFAGDGLDRPGIHHPRNPSFL